MGDTRLGWLAYGWLLAGCPEPQLVLHDEVLNEIGIEIYLDRNWHVKTNSKSVKQWIDKWYGQQTAGQLGLPSRVFYLPSMNDKSIMHRMEQLRFGFEQVQFSDARISSWDRAASAQFSDNRVIRNELQGNTELKQYCAFLLKMINNPSANPSDLRDKNVRADFDFLQRDLILLCASGALETTQIPSWLALPFASELVEEVLAILDGVRLRALGFLSVWKDPGTVFAAADESAILRINKDPFLNSAVYGFSSFMLGKPLTSISVVNREYAVLAADQKCKLTISDETIESGFAETYLRRAIAMWDPDDLADLIVRIHSKKAWHELIREPALQAPIEDRIKMSSHEDARALVSRITEMQAKAQYMKLPSHSWLHESNL